MTIKVTEYIPNSVKDFLNKKMSRREAIKTLAMISFAGFFGLMIKNVFADIWIRDLNGFNPVTALLGNASNGVFTFGELGDVEMGGSTPTTWKPKVASMVSIGDATNPIDIFYGSGIAQFNTAGVRTFTDSDATISNPPTDAQLDNILGAPSSKGKGWCCNLTDTTDNDYWWITVDNGGSKWLYVELSAAV